MSKTFSKIIAFLLMLAPMAVLAGGTVNPDGGNAWDLYVFGNGEVIFNILNAISAMVSMDGYLNMMRFLGVIGVVVIGVMVGFQPKSAGKYLGFFVLVYSAVYATTKIDSNIAVQDEVTGYYNVATGVPAAIGIPAAVISNIGHWMTAQIEQVFSIPGQLTMTQGGGFNMSTSLAHDASQIRITNPNIRQSMISYVSDCVIPDIVAGRVDARSIVNSTDLWATISSNNEAILTTYVTAQNPQGQLVTCKDAHGYIQTDLEAEAPILLQSAASAWHSSAAFNFLSSGVQSSFTWLSDGAMNGSAASTVQQAATIHMYNDTFSASAAMTGNNELVTSIAMAQAEQAQKTTWFTSAELFKDLVGYIYSVLQAFVFAIVPVLLIALMIPGFGTAVIKNYGQILVWLILWMPLLAIINYIIALYGQQGMAPMLSHASGLTMENVSAVTEQTSKFVTAAGFLATMVPMISWGLVKGGIAFTQFISGAIGSGLASQAAGSAATGNISLDSQSMGNQSFGQKNLMPKTSVGFGQTMASMGGAQALTERNWGGSVDTFSGAAVRREARNSMGMTKAETQSEMESTSSQISHSEQALKSASSDFGQSLSKDLSQSLSIGNTDSQSEVLKKMQSMDEMAKQGYNFNISESGQVEVTKASDNTGTVTADASLAAKWKAGGVLGSAVEFVTGASAETQGKVGVALRGSESQRESDSHSKQGSDTLSGANETSVRSGVGQDVSTGRTRSEAEATQDAVRTAESLGLKLSTGTQEAASRVDTHSQQLQQAQEYREDLQKAYSEAYSVETGQNLGQVQQNIVGANETFKENEGTLRQDFGPPNTNAQQVMQDRAGTLNEYHDSMSAKAQNAQNELTKVYDHEREGIVKDHVAGAGNAGDMDLARKEFDIYHGSAENRIERDNSEIKQGVTDYQENARVHGESTIVVGTASDQADRDASMRASGEEYQRETRIGGDDSQYNAMNVAREYMGNVPGFGGEESPAASANSAENANRGAEDNSSSSIGFRGADGASGRVDDSSNSEITGPNSRPDDNAAASVSDTGGENRNPEDSSANPNTENSESQFRPPEDLNDLFGGSPMELFDRKK